MDPSKQVRSLVPERVLLTVMILAVFVLIVGGNYVIHPSSLIPGLDGDISERNAVTGAAADSGKGLGKVGYWMIGIGVIALFWVIFILVYLIKKRKATEETELPTGAMPPTQPVMEPPPTSPEMAKVDEALSMLDKGMIPKEISLATFKPLATPKPKPKRKMKKAEKPVKVAKKRVVKKRVAAAKKPVSKPKRVQDDLARVDEAIAKAERELRR